MLELFDRHVKLGDLIVIEGKGVTLALKNLAIVVGENKGYTIKGIRNITGMVYLIECPTQKEIELRNTLLASYTKLQRGAVVRQKESQEKRISLRKQPPVGGAIFAYNKECWLYLGDCIYKSDTRSLEGKTYINLGKINLDMLLGSTTQWSLINLLHDYTQLVRGGSVKLLSSEDIKIFKDYSLKFVDYMGHVDLLCEDMDVYNPVWINNYVPYRLEMM